MHFGFDEDQVALRDAMGAYLDRRAGLAYLQQAWTDPASDPVWSLWPDLAGMGAQGLLVAEDAGGSGSDWVTMALVLAEAGRVALPLPLVETAAVGLPLVMAAGDPEGVAPGLISGAGVLTVAGCPGATAPGASRADWFIVAGPDVPVLYHRDQVQIEPVQSVDRTRDLGRVTPRGPGRPLVIRSGARPAVSAYDAGALGSAAVLIGLGRALVDMTVGYVKERTQFGVPVGSFQAVKHHLADAAVAMTFAAPPVWEAAFLLSHPGERPAGEVRRSVSLAKAMASDAAARAARQALQCHGAMGYTDDYHLHLWLKRVWCLAAAYGSAVDHRRRIGAAIGVE